MAKTPEIDIRDLQAFNDSVNQANSSVIKTALNASGAAPIYACRAWANFNGAFATNPFTTANGGIRACGNVSSISDLGVGSYQLFFTTAMPDTYYCCVDGQPTGIGSPASISNQIGFNTYATGSVKITVENSGNGAYSDKDICVAIFR